MRRLGRRGTAPALAAALLLLASGAGAGEQRAVYRASGQDARLFDQYDNDGYSLAVLPAGDGGLELRVRVSDSPLQSGAPFPTGLPREAALSRSPERDAFAAAAARGCRWQSQAVSRILLGVATRLSYDPDRRRRQDPAAVFASGRAYCVGFAELAVDLLRRISIRARTVQGVLRARAGEEGYESRIGGAYHRWIEVYYPDRGYVFSDPSVSINGVDARYIPFGRRSLRRPRDLSLSRVDESGTLDYTLVGGGGVKLLARASGSEGLRR